MQITSAIVDFANTREYHGPLVQSIRKEILITKDRNFFVI